MRCVSLVVAALIALSIGGAEAQQPIKEGDALTGTLRLVTTAIRTVPSSSPIRSSANRA